jgi:hypothetical protein
MRWTGSLATSPFNMHIKNTAVCQQFLNGESRCHAEPRRGELKNALFSMILLAKKLHVERAGLATSGYGF